jgi:hypothetical protein
VKALVLVLAAAPAVAQELDAAGRAGVYVDSDHTQVVRSLAAADARFGHFGLAVREQVDLISSASIDVRSSPRLDVLSGASAVAPSMSDRRFETTVGGSWDDRDGHTVTVEAVYAFERDYTSAGGGAHGSWDLAERNTTLLAGVNASHNHVTSIDDPSFDERLDELGVSLGVGQVLGPADAARLRYDGDFLDGYQASPYRAVRFGDWHTALRPGGVGLLFLGTTGPASGLPERVPRTRLRHALVAEWLHSLAAELALATQLRGALDDWGVAAVTAGAELRWELGPWLIRLGGRLYLQRAADFYEAKYLQAPETYTSYTSDKELGGERGGGGTLAVAWRVTDHLVIDVRAELLRYDYDALLLSGRTSLLSDLGFRWQP